MPQSFFTNGYDYNGTAIPIVTAAVAAVPAAPPVAAIPAVPAVHAPRYRPTSGSNNFYRDCFVIDDSYITGSGNFNLIFMTSFIVTLFNIHPSSIIENVSV